MNAPESSRDMILWYLDHHWQVMPVRGSQAPADEDGKRPASSTWKHLQSEPPSRSRLTTDPLPWGGVAVLTGQVSSGLVVLDLDEKDAISRLRTRAVPFPVTPAVATPHGLHWYYSWDSKATGDGPLPGNAVGLLPGLDVRGEGGYVVAPPTLFPSGAQYQWCDELEPWSVPLAPCPDWLRFLIVSRDMPSALVGLRAGVAEGRRNDAAARIIGWLYARGIHHPQLTRLARGWNDLNAPSLDTIELDGVIASIGKAEARRTEERGPRRPPPGDGDDAEAEKKSAAARIVELTLDAATDLFTDERSTPYIRLSRNGARMWGLESEAFRRWAAGRFYADTDKPPTREAIRAAVDVLAYRAWQDGGTYTLSNRTAWGDDGCLWLDMCDPDFRAIRIDTEGWGLVDHPPILFRRYIHQAPLPVPSKAPAEVLHDLLPHCNISPEDDLLFLAWLGTCLIPEIPHPLVALIGPQGCAKTTTARLARSLVDPSQVPLIGLPQDPNELVLLLDHHWMPIFDNTSKLTRYQADHLCRAATGEGFAKRKLYTDQEEVIFSFRRCPIITAVTCPVTAPDLFDRLLRFELQPISAAQRRRESDIDRAALDRDHWLGALLTVTVGALGIIDTISPPRLPRMADFAVWGEAFSQALGAPAGDFLGRYHVEIRRRHEDSAEASNFADAVVAFANLHRSWTGSAGDLLPLLDDAARDLGIPTTGETWPSCPSWLSRRLAEVALDLDALGVHVSKEKKDTDGLRSWRIELADSKLAF